MHGMARELLRSGLGVWDWPSGDHLKMAEVSTWISMEYHLDIKGYL